VLPTWLPLDEYYGELVRTQQAFYRKHLGWQRVMDTAGIIARQLAHGQTNFLNSLFHIERVFRPDLLLADHALPVHYEIPLPQRRDTCSTFTRRVAAKAAPSTPRQSALSKRPGWARRRNPPHIPVRYALVI
jgi:hypothetical protein